MKKYILSILVLSFLILIFIFTKNYFLDTDSFVVYIKSETENAINEGMGFVYKKDNDKTYIITNYHVIHDSNKIDIINNINNKKAEATLEYFDYYTDIAVLSINKNINLKESKISEDKINKGDKLYFYNNFRLEKCIVKNLNNEITIEAEYGNSYYELVSVKGDIENGNSGSAIIDKNNNVVGLLSIKNNDNGIGYYIPISDVINIVNKLENKKLYRANLGATFVSANNKDVLTFYGINKELPLGVVIINPKEGYPLYENGFETGDVIISINDIIIKDTKELQKELYSYSFNEEIEIKYYKNNTYLIKTILLNK